MIDLWLFLLIFSFQFFCKPRLTSLTAIGTKLAPSFPNLFMGHFEDKYFYTYKLQPLIWKPFIDDIFFIWTYGPDELDEFVEYMYLNKCHKTIKFTIETLSKSIFLTLLLLEKIMVYYQQPYTVNPLTVITSEHPRHILNGIPYSQMLRVRCIFTKNDDFLKKMH